MFRMLYSFIETSQNYTLKGEELGHSADVKKFVENREATGSVS